MAVTVRPACQPWAWTPLLLLLSVLLTPISLYAAANDVHGQSGRPAFRVSLNTAWESDPWAEALELLASIRHDVKSSTPSPFEAALSACAAAKTASELLAAHAPSPTWQSLLANAFFERQAVPRVQAAFYNFDTRIPDADFRACALVLPTSSSSFSCYPLDVLHAKAPEILPKRAYELHAKIGADVPLGFSPKSTSVLVYVSPWHPDFPTHWETLLAVVPSSVRLFVHLKPLHPKDPTKTIAVPAGYFAHLRIKDPAFHPALTDAKSPLLCPGLSETDLLTVSENMAAELDSFELVANVTANLPSTTCAFIDSAKLPKKSKWKQRRQRNAVNANSNRLASLVGLSAAKDGLLSINGRLSLISATDWLKITDTLEHDLRLRDDAVNIFNLTWPITMRIMMRHSNAQQQESSQDDETNEINLYPRYNFYFDPAITWLNDIEEDARYNFFSTNLALLMRQMGHTRLRRNVLNLVFFIDLLDLDQLKTLFEIMHLLEQMVLIRLGVVPIVDGDPNSERSRLAGSFRGSVNLNGASATLIQLARKATLEPRRNFDQKHFDEILSLSKRLQVNGAEFFLNGVPFLYSADYQSAFNKVASTELEILQSAFGRGKLKSDDSVGKFMNSFGLVLERRSPYSLLNSPKHLIHEFPETALPGSEQKAPSTHRHTFVHVCGEAARLSSPDGENKDASINQEQHPIATLLKIGQKQYGYALQFETGKSCPTNYDGSAKKTAIAFNGALLDSVSADDFTIEDLKQILEVECLSHSGTLKRAFPEVAAAKNVTQFWRLASFARYLDTLVTKGKQSSDNHVKTKENELKSDRSNISGVFDCKIPGTCLRKIAAKCTKNDDGDANMPSLPDCFEMIAIFDPATVSSQRVAQMILALSRKFDFLNIRVVWVSFAKKTVPDTFTRFITTTTTTASSESASFDTNAHGIYADAAIKNSTETDHAEQNHDGHTTGTDALQVFQDVPQNVLFTLALEVPHTWVVAASYSPLDLDNLVINADGEAAFTLTDLLIEGYAKYSDESLGSSRGVQFVLSRSGAHGGDYEKSTIVMENLGYFQLRATPGDYALSLRPGQSQAIHEKILLPITLDSFSEFTVYPVLRKRPGMTQRSVIHAVPASADADAEAGTSAGGGNQEPEESRKGGDTARPRGVMNAIKSFIDVALHGTSKGKLETEKSGGGDKAGTGGDSAQAELVHVFSVASGHAYERLLSVMVQSVVNTTRASVKFWLIEDFMSPSFKAFLPHLAKNVGFEYQLVTYAWPEWLKRQTEKQRTIWAYKILFLDVLFPLGLRRVIFVDADQIVRADLAQLRDMDLGGAVYGYTPFCSSRGGMDRFRFWESGYWKTHLRGRPYHISALYVIDLEMFRRVAAGDLLRRTYQMLAHDPGSLANLDQDLPNSLQDQLPIFSLPQEWLWCETWCDDKSLATAKTVDLCNNPASKESKLDRARRLIPEWQVYDQRAEKLRAIFSNPQMVSKNGGVPDEKTRQESSTHDGDDESKGEKEKEQPIRPTDEL